MIQRIGTVLLVLAPMVCYIGCGETAPVVETAQEVSSEDVLADPAQQEAMQAATQSAK